MAFRVLVIGGRVGVEFAYLRDILDAALVNRLPDVELVTAGGPGVPALAASYARSRDLPLVAVPLDYPKYRGDAEARRDGRLVELADAAVVVCDDCAPVREMVARLRAKGVPVIVIGHTRPAARVPAEPAEQRPVLRGVPPD